MKGLTCTHCHTSPSDVCKSETHIFSTRVGWKNCLYKRNAQLVSPYRPLLWKSIVLMNTSDVTLFVTSAACCLARWGWRRDLWLLRGAEQHQQRHEQPWHHGLHLHHLHPGTQVLPSTHQPELSVPPRHQGWRSGGAIYHQGKPAMCIAL